MFSLVFVPQIRGDVVIIELTSMMGSHSFHFATVLAQAESDYSKKPHPEVRTQHFILPGTKQ